MLVTILLIISFIVCCPFYGTCSRRLYLRRSTGRATKASSTSTVTTRRGITGTLRTMGSGTRRVHILILYRNTNASALLTGTLHRNTTTGNVSLISRSNTCKDRCRAVSRCGIVILTPRTHVCCSTVGTSASHLKVGLLAAENGRCVSLAGSPRNTVS